MFLPCPAGCPPKETKDRGVPSPSMAVWLRSGIWGRDAAKDRSRLCSSLALCHCCSEPCVLICTAEMIRKAVAKRKWDSRDRPPGIVRHLKYLTKLQRQVFFFFFWYVNISITRMCHNFFLSGTENDDASYISYNLWCLRLDKIWK